MPHCQNEPTPTDHSDSFASKILPGGHTHEYTVFSTQPIMTLVDVFVVMILSFVVWMDKTAYWIWILAFGWIWLKLRNVRQESLLVMRDIGVQVKTTYWSGRTESKFINRLKIENVVINEGITWWQIKPYIAILLKDQDKMLIVFENLLPPLHPALLTTYQGTRHLLFSTPTTP